MSLASPKRSPKMAAFPRSVSSIAATVAVPASLLFFASWLLVSYRIGSTFRGYFYGVASTFDQSSDKYLDYNHKNSSSGSNLELPMMRSNSSSVIDNNEDLQVSVTSSVEKDSLHSESNLELPFRSKDSVNSKDKKIREKIEKLSEGSSRVTEKQVDTSSSTASNASESNSVHSKDRKTPEKPEKLSEGSSRATEKQSSSAASNASESNSFDSKGKKMPKKPVKLSKGSSRATEKQVDISSSAASNSSESNSVHSVCDLYHGKWFYDPQGPLYTNNSCPALKRPQNCQSNGRPDNEYENWRWKPSQCDFPRFDAKKFLELMRGKTIAFIGDSVARNQMESLVCILWQFEVPKNIGNRRMERWLFRSTSVWIVRIWSSWLVKRTSEKFDFAPARVTKLHLDVPDNSFMERIPNFDVIVISSGHWFAKQSVYIYNNEIVGGQLWSPGPSRPMKVNNVDAYGISMETALSAIVTHPNYTGLTILRSYSPDHYEHGAWNTGGTCTGNVKPLATGELVENAFTDIMYKKQMMGFEQAVKKATNKSKLRLMDITQAFGYRHDGHPGPYKYTDPNKNTKRGPDGKPPPQDCLHWCMPGPIDTWNELLLEIIKREFEGHQKL
ncbi:hypothetical protein DITRI_Ditri04bG0187700 [Diplodiscus trichospermus]